MKDREYNHRPEENWLAPEYSKLPPEIYGEDKKEYDPLPSEIFTSCGEYNRDSMEISSEEEEQKNSRARKKILRKMAYAITAAASVVVMGQTLELPVWTPPDYTISEEENSKWWEEIAGTEGDRETESVSQTRPDRETEFVNQTEMTTQEYVEQTTVEFPVYTTSVGTSLSQYDGRGYTACGVMPVSENGLWGLIDYTGQVLVEPAYPEFVSSPNDHGYTVFGDGNRCYIYNAVGRLVYTSPDNAEYVMIGEDDIITVNLYSYDTLEETGWCRVFYQTLAGQIIYDSGNMVAEDGLFVNAIPFHEGRGYVYVYYAGLDMAYLYEITGDGGTLLQVGSTSEVYGPDGAISQGCLLVRHSVISGYTLYWPETGAHSYNIEGLQESTLKAYGVEYETRESVSGMGASPYLEWHYNSYKHNGSYMYNYGVYGVISVYDVYAEKYVKDFLVDLSHGVKDEASYGVYYYDKIIAAYDDIWLDDFHYLAAMDHGEYFYIDYAGNVVSDSYNCATSFIDRGYAMVLEGNTAYVINDRFEKLKSIEGVDIVGYCGDCFTIHYSDGTVELLYFVED